MNFNKLFFPSMVGLYLAHQASRMIIGLSNIKGPQICISYAVFFLQTNRYILQTSSQLSHDQMTSNQQEQTLDNQLAHTLVRLIDDDRLGHPYSISSSQMLDGFDMGMNTLRVHTHTVISLSTKILCDDAFIVQQISI